MRVLILSAILACVGAAPSAPIFAIASIIPAAIPTLSPGDLQAAAINAKVQAEDHARAIAEQARLAAEDQARAIAEQARLAAEDQARAIAEQARLAAEVAKDQAKLALEGQQPIAYAAPSAPVLAVVAPSSGDLQAAAIDAKVQAEDQAQVLADQARTLADQAKLSADVARDQAELALENQKEKTEEVTAIVKEKSEDLFWNVEDKKWQAIDAVKTVEAKIDGAVARNAEAIAKSLTIPVVAPLPYANLAYAYYPGLIPLVKDEKLPIDKNMYDICQTYNRYRSLNTPLVAPLPYANLVYAPYAPGLTPYAIDPCAQFIRK